MQASLKFKRSSDFSCTCLYAGTQVVDFHVAGESGVTWSLNSTSNFTINSQGVVTVGDVLDREVSETLLKTLF